MPDNSNRADQIEITSTAQGWEYGRRSGLSYFPMDWKRSLAEAKREACKTARCLGLRVLVQIDETGSGS